MKKYEKLAEDIKQKISDKIFVERIPSERKLAEMHDVSINTVKNALALLQKQGVVYTKPGSGHYIKHNKVYNFLNFDDERKVDDFDLKSNLLSFEIGRSDKLYSELLEIKEGSLIYKIKRVRFSNERPQYIENVAIPFELFPNLTVDNLSSSLVNYMQAELGEKIEFSTNIVEAISLNADQSELLQSKENDPALLIRSQSFVKSGQLVAYYVNIHVNSSFTFIKYLNQ